MFESAVHHPIISLFSSTGSNPLELFSQNINPTTPGQSCICLLHDTKSEPRPAPPTILLSPSAPLSSSSTNHPDDHSPSDSQGYTLDQTVLHLQSPDLRRTYVQCPPHVPDFSQPPDALYQRSSLGGASSASRSLGIRHPWIHLQVRNLGKDWSFEVGVVDSANRAGVLRLSTFQTEPRIKLRSGKPPLLHLPLSFPGPASRPLTSWTTIKLHLPTYLSHFSDTSLQHEAGAEENPSLPTLIPKGGYSYVSYVRVYATCRLRRIWVSDSGSQQSLPWEFELFADDS